MHGYALYQQPAAALGSAGVVVVPLHGVLAGERALVVPSTDAKVLAKALGSMVATRQGGRA